MPASKPPLDSAFIGPEAKRRYVRRLFATIAERYDLITVLLSFGRDRHWKRRLVDLADLGPGSRVLDLACGTGDIAFEAAARGAVVTGVDITLGMLTLANAKPQKTNGVAFVAGDMSATKRRATWPKPTKSKPTFIGRIPKSSRVYLRLLCAPTQPVRHISSAGGCTR